MLGHLSDPQTLNRYAYCGGDPVNYVDPTGDCEDETGNPNKPFVTPGEGQSDTGKLKFSNKTTIGKPSKPTASASLGSVKVSGRGKVRPDTDAIGAHSTFKRDPVTDQITNYQTWEPNPKNPSGFDEALRYDGIGREEFNKITG